MMTSARELAELSDSSDVLVADQSTEGAKVVLVDPSALSRSCTLVGLSPGLGLVATAAASLEDIPSDVVPDIVIFQNFHVRGNISILSQLLDEVRARWSRCATVIVTDERDASDLLEGLRSGAQALLTNSVGMETLLESLRLVRKGYVVYPKKALQIMSDAMSSADGSRRPKEFLNDPSFNRDRFKNLTVRQKDVLRLLSLGLSNKAIGLELKISESTVKVHIRSIMEQTGVSNRIQIIAHLMNHGAEEGLAGLNGVETI